jgi:hypothetical protein
MRKSIFLAPALLAACSAVPAQPVVHGETPGHVCTADGAQQFSGQVRSDPIGAEIERVSNAAVLRWAPPGVMLTMDYRADRVTVWLDPSGKITQIKCG